jgi:hypothetical protein
MLRKIRYKISRLAGHTGSVEPDIFPERHSKVRVALTNERKGRTRSV